MSHGLSCSGRRFDRLNDPSHLTRATLTKHSPQPGPASQTADAGAGRRRLRMDSDSIMLLGVHVPAPQHHASSPLPTDPVSPTDSGYDSTLATSPTLDQAEKDGRHLLEAPWGHSDDDLSDSDGPFGEANQGRTQSGRTAAHTTRQVDKQSTLPKQTARLRLPRFQRLDLQSGIGRPSSRPLRQPDRFIPARPQLAAELTERFKTSKAPHELTATERLLRHNGAAEDPFPYRPRTTTSLALDLRAQSLAGTFANRNRG